MARRRRYVYPEDAVTVLIDAFRYEVFSIGDSGVLLTKEQMPPVHIPYGSERIPTDILEHVLKPGDFTIDEFFRALERYLAGA